ncbi:hypothetical protein ABH935_006685 [Catenulispora sp. GAS73]|uniref:hypothetical protein n=1 Tax=Catenulispora sp. GAS73 TaxID=3156269 RepID=UPI0035190BFA
MSSVASHDPEPQPGDEEVSELRRRIARLEAEAETASRDRRPVHHRVRTGSSVLVIVLASVLALLSVVSVWAANTVTDTDRFVSTLGPLAKNPQVQTGVSNRISTIVLDQVDVDSVVKQLSQAASSSNLPPQTAALLSRLNGPIDSGLKSLVGTVVDKVVTSDAFASVWNNALRTAHASFEKALTGKGGGAVNLMNGEVQLDLGPAVAMVKTQLVDQGFPAASRIPTVNTTFTIYKSSSLGKLKTYFRLLQIVGDWLPVFTVLIAAAGVFLARNRRRALIGAAIGFAAAMLVLGIALAVFRSFFLDQLPADVNAGAAGATYDALVRFLRISTRTVGTLAVLVALGAFLSGPAPMALWIRAAFSSGIGAVRAVADSAGFRAGPVDRFTARHKRWIGIAILLAASVVFVLWNHPTGLVVFWFALVIAVAFAIREFFAPGPGLIRRDETAVDAAGAGRA